MASSEPTKYTSKLTGSRILVIGGTSGIGFGVAEAVIENGAYVIVSSSSAEKVRNAVQRLESTYPSAKGKVQGIPCNLASQQNLETEVAKLFEQVGQGGKLDHVVYTAGDTIAVGKFEQFTLKDIQQAGMTRFFAPMIVAQHLRKHLKDGPASSYIMTTGGASERPRKDWSVVISYLTGLQGWTRGLAVDLAPIRVNLVGPGPVETELWDSFKQYGDWEALRTQFTERTTTKTFGKVEDVVEGYLYLMKDRNTTGSIIYTNGGTLLL